MSTFRIGQQVYFGRPGGERTLGAVTKVNRRTIKVRQDEPRGTRRAYAVGTVWTVPPALVTPVDASEAPDPVLHAARSAAAFRVGDRVAFTSSDGERVKGTVHRVNRKTVSVTPDGRSDGCYWRVAPKLLAPA